MFEANKRKTQYLLTPGDYTSWGDCVPTNVAGGTSLAPKLIAYYHPDDDDQNPVDRVGGNEALCADFHFTGVTTTNWMVHGITTRGGASNWLMDGGCSGITFDYCLIEDKAKTVTAYMIRIREATDCTIQRCVIRNFILNPKKLSSDSFGVAIGNIPQDVIGIRILDCEIYNVGDCIQITDAKKTTPWKPVEVVIEGCDLYMTEAYHIFDGSTDTQTTWLENGVDIKAGSSSTGKLRVSNNRIWGFRRNAKPTAKPTALGEGIVIQRLARNIEVSNNIIGDCPRGMKDENWPISGTLGPKTVTFASDHILTTTEEHHFLTGQGQMQLTTTGALPTGLSTTVGYYIIVLGTTTFSLAATCADAKAGTPVVGFSDKGTGTHKIRIKVGQTRNITVTGNQFHDICDYADSDAGSVWAPVTDIAYTNNYIARSMYLCANSPTEYWGPVFTGNIRAEVDDIQRPEKQTPTLPYDPALNTIDTHTGLYDTYERKRWTGIEVAYGAIRLDP